MAESRSDETLTYRDGVGVVRCATCLHALHTPTGEPLLSVRVDDLEAVVRILFFGTTSVSGRGGKSDRLALVTRLAQALGLSVEQIVRREDQEATDDEGDGGPAVEGGDV